MPDFDFGLAYEFIDQADQCPRQLRFQRSYAPADDPRTFDGTGQLVAVVTHLHRVDNGHIMAISRPGVTFDAVEAALDGWQTWAMIGDYQVNLATIRRRIHAASLA